MRTEKQAEASRLNGAKSHGPLTAEGKARSRRNALKSGLYTRDVINDLEDRADFQRIFDDYYDLYTPYTAEERTCFDMLIRYELEWRRLIKVETELWEYEVAKTNPSNLQNWAEAFLNGQIGFMRIQRYIETARRNVFDALDRLKKLKAAREAADAEPVETEPTSPDLGFVPSIQAKSQSRRHPLGFVPSLPPQPALEGFRGAILPAGRFPAQPEPGLPGRQRDDV